MSLNLFFRIAFLVVFLSFVYVMILYTKQAKAHGADVAERVRAHHDHEVPLLLKLRQLFGIPFYLGTATWLVAPKYIDWAAIEFPAWLQWVGLTLGLVAVALNEWSHNTLSSQLGKDFNPALRF